MSGCTPESVGSNIWWPGVVTNALLVYLVASSFNSVDTLESNREDMNTLCHMHYPKESTRGLTRPRVGKAPGISTLPLACSELEMAAAAVNPSPQGWPVDCVFWYKGVNCLYGVVFFQACY